MSAVLERIRHSDGGPYGWSFYCPGCEHDHVIPVEGPNGWNFNGNEECPTFSPSLLNRCRMYGEDTDRVCHLFVQSGQLVFLGDCTHKHASQLVPMVERPADKDFTP